MSTFNYLIFYFKHRRGTLFCLFTPFILLTMKLKSINVFSLVLSNRRSEFKAKAIGDSENLGAVTPSVGPNWNGTNMYSLYCYTTILSTYYLFSKRKEWLVFETI